MSRRKTSLVPVLEARGTEWLCAGIMVCWGVTLALPVDLRSQTAFAALHHYGATQDVWGWSLGAAGLARMVALAINGRWPRTPVIRMIGASFGFAVWLQLSWLCLTGSTARLGLSSTAFGVYAVLALAELTSIYRAAHEARYDHP